MRNGIIAVVCCLGGFAPVWLQADENGKARQQQAAPRSESFQRVLKQFDRNGDGRLNDQERQAARQGLEQRRQQAGNRDQSRRTSSNRNRSAGSNNRNRSSADRRTELMKRFDENGNGKLDPPELARLRQSTSRTQSNDRSRSSRSAGNSRMSREELLKKFDTNQNGRIDGTEMQKVRASFGPRERDSVSATVPPRGRLDREDLLKQFDQDRNGRLDAAERKQAFDAMRSKKTG